MSVFDPPPMRPYGNPRLRVRSLPGGRVLIVIDRWDGPREETFSGVKELAEEKNIAILVFEDSIDLEPVPSEAGPPTER